MVLYLDTSSGSQMTSRLSNSEFPDTEAPSIHTWGSKSATPHNPLTSAVALLPFQSQDPRNRRLVESRPEALGLSRAIV
jgi:hypothetical protein